MLSIAILSILYHNVVSLLSCRSCWLSRAYEKEEGLVSKYMSVHKDIFHLEQKFMYSYTFWIVMRFFYIVVYRRRRRRRWTFVASSWSFINTIYILFSSASSIFSHSYCSCFLPAFHERTAEIKYRFLYFRNEKISLCVLQENPHATFSATHSRSLSCPKDIFKKMRKRAYTTTVIF